MAALPGKGVNGSFTGLITDPGGSVVAGAEVVARNIATGVTSAGRTNDSGAFNLPSVSIGTYGVRVQMQGFKTFAGSGIIVETAQVVRVDATLEIGAPQETVTVTAEAPLLQRETSSVGTQISDTMVKELPYQLSGGQRTRSRLSG